MPLLQRLAGEETTGGTVSSKDGDTHDHLPFLVVPECPVPVTVRASASGGWLRFRHAATSGSLLKTRQQSVL
ncbi:hypothetical protein GCM10010112_66020 [Actinoplanes lobatus]|uniref:Uncharacterized protein n=1 Tax=Actinoplanes lobatus TaxID=113568 RepID=A0ABQ4ATH9_9ACTN|nr:hypothetical protein GCM10010112_66020 [Actinoplanes lobatus]GIE44351.1 hypothetical protein Alo02nite_72490 [Actinoplanes lobatus]